MATSQEIRSFVDRILRLKEEEDAVKKAIRDVYAEAADRDIDKTGLGQVVTHVRKRGKNPADFDAKEAVFHGYLVLYDASLTHTHAYAREPLPDSELTDTQEQPEEPATQSEPSHRPFTSLAAREADESAAPHSHPQPNLLPGAVKAPEADSSPASGAALSEADVPAFLCTSKSAADYRPHCQHPDNCGSSNPTGHRYQCRRAMEAASETEAA